MSPEAGRVKPGDPLKIPAGAFNDILDVIEESRNSREPAPGASLDSTWSPRLVVEAYRDDQADAGIGDRAPVVLRFFDSDLPDNGREFADNRDPKAGGALYFAIAPTDADAGTSGEIEASPVGIALGGIDPGTAGSIAIAGAVMCWVDITNTAHLFARLNPAEDSRLISDDSGPCRIVWTDTASTGVQLAVVLLNVGTTNVIASTNVPTVYAIASLGGSPPTYTVRQVHRNSGGSLVDDAGPVNHTAYEAQGRQPWIDTAGSPTREYPLFTDSNGKKYFQIDQDAQGDPQSDASPSSPAIAPLIGFVNIGDQVLGDGKKTFRRAVIVNASRDADANSKTDTIPPLQVWTDGTPSSDYALTVYSGVGSAGGITVGARDTLDWTSNYPGRFDGELRCVGQVSLCALTGTNGYDGTNGAILGQVAAVPTGKGTDVSAGTLYPGIIGFEYLGDPAGISQAYLQVRGNPFLDPGFIAPAQMTFWLSGANSDPAFGVVSDAAWRGGSTFVSVNQGAGEATFNFQGGLFISVSSTGFGQIAGGGGPPGAGLGPGLPTNSDG